MISNAVFLAGLLNWHSGIDRELPWKDTSDPYAIWLSEIILQQTQISQGIPYYKRFIKAFPTVEDLARAAEQEVLRMWQGLGYNSRARNLLKAAKLIVKDFNGNFPDTFEGIKALPGIGEYTAAAISSFAFEMPKPVLDTNVIRFFSRLWGIEALSTSASMRQQLYKQLEPLIIQTTPSAFNQAIMDFGALHCKAKKPLCESCPFSDGCVAYRQQSVDQYPKKPEKKPRKQRFLHFLVFLDGEQILLRKRPAGDIWTSLYDFPVLETSSPAKPLQKTHEIQGIINQKLQMHCAYQSKPYRQTLTHQEIHAWFYEHPVGRVEVAPVEGYYWVKKKNLKNFAFPKLIYCYLQDKSIL